MESESEAQVHTKGTYTCTYPHGAWIKSEPSTGAQNCGEIDEGDVVEVTDAHVMSTDKPSVQFVMLAKGGWVRLVKDGIFVLTLNPPTLDEIEALAIAARENADAPATAAAQPNTDDQALADTLAAIDAKVREADAKAVAIVQAAADAKATEDAKAAANAMSEEDVVIAAETKAAVDAKAAEDARIAEEARLAVEAAEAAEAAAAAAAAAAAEAARLAEEARLAAEIETARVAEEARVAELARVEEEARAAKEVADAKAAEEARVAAEIKAAADAETDRVNKMNAEAKAHAEAILAHLHPHSPIVHHIAPERPLSWPTVSMQKKSAETTPTSTAATTPGTSAKSPGAANLTDGALLIDHHPAKLGAFSAKSPLGNVPGASFLISHAMAREATHARLRQEPIAPPSIHMSNVVARVIIGSKLVRKAKAAKERVAFKDALHKAHHEPTVHAEVPSVLDHAAIAVDDMGNIIISASPSTPTSRPGSQRRGSMRTEELKASVAADFKQQLTDIYTVYNPARLSKIPDIMAHFVGREQMLLQELHRKYDMQDEHVHLLGHELEDIEYPTFDASELDEIDTNARGRSDDEPEEELEDENLFMRDSQPNSPTPLSPSSFSMYADTPTSDRGGGASRSEFFKLWGGLFGEVTDAEACSSPMPAVSASTAEDSADEDEDDMFTEVDGNDGTEDEDAGIIDDSVTLPPEDYFKLSNEIYSNYLNSRGMSSPRAEIEAEVQAEGNSKTEEDAAGNASGGKAAKKAWHSSLPEGDAELRSAMVKDVEDLLKSHQPKPEEAEEWQMKLAQMAIHLDEILYNYSNSSDEYKDRATLQARLQELAERDHRKKTLKQQQQRLLLLRHSAKCKLAGNCAISAYCGEMKHCWQHMKSCQDSKCKAAHCLSSRFVMSHYVKCKKDLCPLCGPVKPLEAAQHAHHVLLQQQPQKSEASKKALPKRNKGDDGSAATLLDEDACIIS